MQTIIITIAIIFMNKLKITQIMKHIIVHCHKKYTDNIILLYDIISKGNLSNC